MMQPHEPFNDVTVAELLNILYARRDSTSSGVARNEWQYIINTVIVLGDEVRGNRQPPNAAR